MVGGVDVEPGDPANEVFCDNARLRADDPQWLFCNTWPTHNTIHRETGRVRAYTFFVGPFLPADAKPPLDFYDKLMNQYRPAMEPFYVEPESLAGG